MAKKKLQKQLEGQKDLRSRQGHDTQSFIHGFAEHLKYSLAVDPMIASSHDHYHALCLAIRDRLIERWVKTKQVHSEKKVKRVYYLSFEYLMGRAIGNNTINLKFETSVRQALEELGYSWEELRDLEVDEGLGNGGLGRLAACFLDSLATLEIPAFGYGLRYEYGLFRQEIENGYQVEKADDWLLRGNPWEVEREDISVKVQFGGQVTQGRDGRRYWVDTSDVMGVPFDTPIVGYGGNTINTLRLWSGKSVSRLDFQQFNSGHYREAACPEVDAKTLTQVLYPNDSHPAGHELRFKQQYFFVACSLHDALRRFKLKNLPLTDIPNLIAMQLNDTHPALAIPELMRILVDEEFMSWEDAWDICVRTFAYTNHTLMPEALETWPVSMFERILPRHMEIIYEINHRFMQEVSNAFSSDRGKMERMSIIQEGDEKMVRMAHLSIIGSHSTNGVAALHSKLVKEELVPDFYEMFPERFNNKTNGVTQRRWLLKANPPLAKLITENIGDNWIIHLTDLKQLEPLADDPKFRRQFREVKRKAKQRLSKYCKKHFGYELNLDSIFDVQVKRLHEYKRQLLNALHIVMLYNRVRKGEEIVPRTFIFGAKAAPGYDSAKLIIKFINNLSFVINNDPRVRDLIKIHFLPNYRVSMAEHIFPASDLSEQISTAGTEASGTGNMKFMINGALTIGTLDGANVEIVEEAGIENAFIFGMKDDEVLDLKPRYNPRGYYERDPEIREAIDLIANEHFNVSEPGIFTPIVENLLNVDYYMCLADLRSYAKAQKKVDEAYRDQDNWSRMAILNMVNSGKFSSDRTIQEYADEIWDVKAVPIDHGESFSEPIEEARFKE